MTPLSGSDLLALLPWLVTAGVPVLAMLAIAVRRSHGLVYGVTVTGILAALAACAFTLGMTPRPVTSLFLVDRYAVLFTALALGAGLAVTCVCRGYLAARSDQPEEAYLLILTALLGAGVLAMARHFAGFFLGLETLSVSLFALIAYPFRNERALEAGIKYLVLSGVASGFLVFGMALVYAGTGTLEFAGLAAAPETLTSLMGMILILAAAGFKLSLVPFHLWTADVYQGAPAPVTALLATVSKGAVFVLLLRFALSGGLTRTPLLADILGLLAAVSMLAGNLLALYQNNVKRLLAYSSIAHMGYLIIVLVAGMDIGAAFAGEALLFYLAAYFVTTLAAFGVVTVLSPEDAEAEDLDDYYGLFRSRPWLAGVLTAALLSLAGIPLTAGFVGKFYLFAAAGKAGLWALLAVLVIGSGLGLYYYLRFVSLMVRAPEAGEVAVPRPIPVAGGLVLAVLLLLLFGLGIYPSAVMEALAGALR